MSIEAIRFRASEQGVILQVQERKERIGHAYQYELPGEWRDAKVEDLLDVARFTSFDSVSRQLVEFRAQLDALWAQRQHHGVDQAATLRACDQFPG